MPDDPVTRYAKFTLDHPETAGSLIRLACRRHLEDLRREDIEWHPELVERVIAYFRFRLTLDSGEFEGDPFILEPFQEFIIGSLYGWLRPDGTRRYRTAYIEMPKGNGKSPLGAGAAIYAADADNEAGAQCYFAAVKKEQANIPFQMAVGMVERSPVLRAKFTFSGQNPVWRMSNLSTRSFLRPISSEKKAQSGPLPHFALLDEVHEMDNPIVLDMMRKGVKNRRQPLIFEITNSGYDRQSICFQHHEYSRAILEGTKPNDEWFAYICCLDPEDFPEDEKSDPIEHLLAHPEVWIKANPGLGTIAKHDYIRKELNEALGMPAKRNLTLRLNFCVWTEANETWIPVEMWEVCGGTIREEDLYGQVGYGGIDLSATQDTTSVALFFPGEDGDRHRILWHHWLPEANLNERIRKDGMPYEDWARRGYLTLTEGNKVDYRVIEKWIVDANNKFDIREWAYDPWNAHSTVTNLTDEGLTMVEARQGGKTMSAPIKALEVMIGRREINHGNNPILKAQVAATALRKDENDNYALDKLKSTGRIDGVVALVDAVWRATLSRPKPPSVYEQRRREGQPLLTVL